MCSALVFSSTDSGKTLLDPAHIILKLLFLYISTAKQLEVIPSIIWGLSGVRPSEP